MFCSDTAGKLLLAGFVFLISGSACMNPEAATLTKNRLVMQGRISQTAPVNRGEVYGCGGIQGKISACDSESGTLTLDCTDSVGKTYTLRTSEICSISLREELSAGVNAALLYAGSLVGAGDDIRKVTPVILLDAQEHWDIRSTPVCALLSDEMSTFSVKDLQSDDVYSFLKDNCPSLEGLEVNCGDGMSVIYVTTDSGDRYPLKIVPYEPESVSAPEE